jgi:hypothetical protein
MGILGKVLKAATSGLVEVATTAAVGSVNTRVGDVLLEAAGTVGVPKKITENMFVQEAAALAAPTVAYVANLRLGNKLSSKVVDRWLDASVAASTVKLALKAGKELIRGK